MELIDKIEARMKKRAYKLLDDETTRELFNLIISSPGITFESLSDKFRLREGLLAEKLGNLIKAKLIVLKKTKEYSRYEPTEFGKEIFNETISLYSMLGSPPIKDSRS